MAAPAHRAWTGRRGQGSDRTRAAAGPMPWAGSRPPPRPWCRRSCRARRRPGRRPTPVRPGQLQQQAARTDPQLARRAAALHLPTSTRRSATGDRRPATGDRRPAELPVQPRSDAAFPFGHGLSYTDFDIDLLAVDREQVPTDGEFTVSARVRNTVAVAGAETVQLYAVDPVAQVTRPVRSLLGFAKVQLAPGEQAVVRFHVRDAFKAGGAAQRAPRGAGLCRSAAPPRGATSHNGPAADTPGLQRSAQAER